jgi:hypothetical protein
MERPNTGSIEHHEGEDGREPKAERGSSVQRRMEIFVRNVEEQHRQKDCQ